MSATIGNVSVETGLDVLVRRRGSRLRGRSFGLVAHQASVDSRHEHAATLLADLPRARLVRLFAPEHGLWGAAQDHAPIAGTRDPVTDLPVVSLYGERRAPTLSMLRGLDALVVDLQDVGSRYYTFVWTMALAMPVCARAGVPVIVLDRPNPLGGTVEGNVPDPAFASVGAPYLDAHAFADDLNRRRLPGVHFRPARFVPTFHKWAGRLCGGVQIHVTHAASFKPFITGLAVVASARRLGRRAFRWRRPPYEFEHRKLPFDILCGTDTVRRAIERGEPLATLERRWQPARAHWLARRARWLAYR